MTAILLALAQDLDAHATMMKAFTRAAGLG